MRKTAKLYSLCICALAVAATFGLYVAAPKSPSGEMLGVALLGLLAVMSEAIAYLLPRAAYGSIAFILYLSIAFVAPSWAAAVFVLLVKACTEIVARRNPLKGAFNVGQHVLSIVAAVLVYRGLGGVSMLIVEPKTLLHMTAAVGWPAIAATFASLFANTVLVSIFFALLEGGTFATAWKSLRSPTLGFDIIGGPLVFLFAWVYVAFGPIAAAGAWVPFLLLRHAQKTNLELEQMNHELLELMVKSLEARDPYTSGHSRRVREYSTTIARALELSPREVEHVARAALLHDVGKIHEKYAPILSKADRLTPDEWRTMKEHPADGASLVATMTKLRDVVPAIRHHHENWDGTGYPDGMAGELIPVAARIIRFADTIDAMVSERPYRRPMTEAEVRAEIVKCRGTQFDPGISDRLLSSALWRNLFESPARSATPNGLVLELVSPSKREPELQPRAEQAARERAGR